MPRPLPLEETLSFLADKEPFILLETALADAHNRFSYLFFEPSGVIEACNYAELPDLFRQIDSFLDSGCHLAGFFSYEAGFGLEQGLSCPHSPPRLFPHVPGGNSSDSVFSGLPSSSFPLARFYIFQNPLVFDHRTGLFNEGPLPGKTGFPENYTLAKPRLNTGSSEYKNNIGRIKELITAGETYQVNYTLKCKFGFSGSPFALYRDLRQKQPVAYSAFIKDRDFSLLSFSPELFFRKSGPEITVRPMKGTIARGKNEREDTTQAQTLRRSLKERAENLMIVDLLRSDLGRISKVGTVRVDSLFDLEKYETLFQMTSTVSGTLKDNLSIRAMFEAIFPSGSVTGAPKIRTMEIIRELEKEERAVYTGGVGVFFPNRDAVFNVAIRTLLIRGGEGEMGIGSGVTFDSDPDREYAECKLKALFLAQCDFKEKTAFRL